MKDDLRILLERSFRNLFLARTCSLLAITMIPIALAFAVLEMEGGSATLLGLVLAGRSVAQIAVLLFGGALADRLPRNRLMIGSDLIAFATQAAFAALFITGSGMGALLIALSAANGMANALFLPASRAVVTQVVPPQRFPAANSLLRLSRNGASIGGAALAGVLVVAVGSGGALALAALLFLMSAGFLSRLRIERSAPTSGTSLFRELVDGWHEFRSRRWVWLSVLQFAFVNGCFAAIHVLGPQLARDQLGGAAAWSAIIACQAVGLVAGSLIAMRVRPSFPMRMAVAATFGFLPPFFLLAAGAPVWLIAASMLVNGLCVDLYEVLWDTTIQKHIPHDRLSRIYSYDFLGSFALSPLLLVAVGPLADIFGTEYVLTGTGALLGLVTLTIMLSRSVRRLPADPTKKTDAMS